MGRKKKQPPDDPERSARFVEMAERIQDEKAEDRFEEVMKRISLKNSNIRERNIVNEQ